MQVIQEKENRHGEGSLKALDLVLLVLPLPLPPLHLHLVLLCMSLQFMLTVTMPLYMRMILIYFSGHKLTYPILSIMAKDIILVPVSTVSSESYFSLAGRIIEERRRRLLPETMEMLTCIKDWELEERRLEHAVDNQELEDSFKNLYLDEDEASTSGGAAGTSRGAAAGTS